VGNALLSLAPPAEGQVAAIGIVVGTGQQTQEGVGAGDACLVQENRILGRQLGVWVHSSEAVQIDRNLVAGIFDRTFGMALIESERCRVGGNHFLGFAVGVLLFDGRSNTVAANHLRGGTTALLALAETGWVAEDNTIQAIGGAGILGAFLHDATRLARNRLRSCASSPGNSFPVAIGVHAGDFTAANEVVVESCEVLDTGIGAGGKPIPQATWGIWVWALGCTLHGNLVTTRDPTVLDPQLESRAAIVWGHLSFVLADRVLAFGEAALLDNKFVGNGRSALLEVARIPLTPSVVFQFERVSFSNNDCFHFSAEPDDRFATVSLHGQQMIAMGNHVRATTPFFSFHFHGNRRTLFLGNIADGGVLAYPAPRPAPILGFNFTG
jgi:hypothetical protein